MRFVCVRCRREVDFEDVGSFTGIIHNETAYVYCSSCLA